MKYQYPFTTNQPPLDEVIDFIAPCLLEDIKKKNKGKATLKTVRKRLHSAIRDDQRNHQRKWVNKNGDKPRIINAKEFFTWARTKNKLKDALSEIENLPYEPAKPTCSRWKTKIIAHAIETPQTFDELEKSFITQASENFELKQKITQLENINTELNVFKRAPIEQHLINRVFNHTKCNEISKRSRSNNH